MIHLTYVLVENTPNAIPLVGCVYKMQIWLYAFTMKI